MLLLAAAPAGFSETVRAQEPQAARPLAWNEVDKPGIAGETILAPSEINRIAASHDIVYALDTANSRLHRSDNAGLTFTDITKSLEIAGAVLPGEEIAVAPDRPQYVAVVTDSRKRVYISDDSGATWHGTDDIPLTTDTIQCIAISNGYLPSGSTVLHDMAIGTALWGDGIGDGQVWTFQIGGAFSSWTNQNVTVSGSMADVSAVAFSSRYSADSWLLATASDASNTYLCIKDAGNLSTPATTAWNAVTGYPMAIAAGGDALPPAIIVSSISLPSDYGGTDQAARLAFIGYNRTPAGAGANDVYRIDDDVSPPVQPLNVADATFINVSSMAYFGTLVSGKLIAGATDPDPISQTVAQVKWTLNPLGTPPGTLNSVVWYVANQPPSGPGNALVAWSNDGTAAFCGTGQTAAGFSFDESAFSQSLDNGNSWAQVSLINTSLQMTDIAPASNSRSLFMSSFNVSGPESVWRSAGEPLGRYWGRLLTMPANTDRVVLRMSPQYSTDYTLYAVEVDNTTTVQSPGIPSKVTGKLTYNNLLEVSESRGNYWTKRWIPRPVIDMIAASQHTLYLAATGGYIRKSIDAGLTWGGGVATGLNDINMLALGDNGDVFASSTDGWVAYSTDEGSSFTKIEPQVNTLLRDIQVQPDAHYAANHVIYASGRTYDAVDNTTHYVTDAGLWRWTIGESTQWEQFDRAVTDQGTVEQISGLKTGPEGTLYALRAEVVNFVRRETANDGSEDITAMTDNRTGGMNRTLGPLFPIANDVEWDVINRTLSDNRTAAFIAFNPSPLHFAGNLPWLKISGDMSENDLWAIDTSDGTNDQTTAIYRFRDNICKAGPATTGPTEVGCDPVTGRNQQVDLFWEQLSLSDWYDLQLAKDTAFTLKINPMLSNENRISSVSDNLSLASGSILISTDPVSVTSPAVWLSPGSLPEAGADYYWRIRTYHAATGEFIRSPWSTTDSFLVKPGFPVLTAYQGPLLLSPTDGCECAYRAPVSFSWSPYKETTQYQFELSESADMSRPLVSATVNSAAFVYDGRLNYDAAYFWRVTALQPAPSDYSATFTFHTGSLAQGNRVIALPGGTPVWVFIGSAIGLLAIIVLMVLIFRRWGVLP